MQMCKFPLYIAKASKGKKLICFSSDQVYSACSEDGPYSEDVVNPGNIYVSHKMEQRVLDILPSSVMLRAEWMYDMDSNKGNYFTNLLNAEKSVSFSSSQYRGITYLKEVAEKPQFYNGVLSFRDEKGYNIFNIMTQLLSYILVSWEINTIFKRFQILEIILKI